MYDSHLELREAMDLIGSGFFSPEDRNLFRPLMDNLLEEDRYLVLADFDAYMKKQEEVARAYLDHNLWTRKCILNVARAGIFSSDRTIEQYAEEILAREADARGAVSGGAVKSVPPRTGFTPR